MPIHELEVSSSALLAKENAVRESLKSVEMQFLKPKNIKTEKDLRDFIIKKIKIPLFQDFDISDEYLGAIAEHYPMLNPVLQYHKAKNILKEIDLIRRNKCRIDTMPEELRHLILAPKGKNFIELRYPNLQKKILIALSSEISLIDALNTNKNIYEETAKKLLGISEINGKMINFSKALWSAFDSKNPPETLAKTLSISIEKSSEYIRRFFSCYPSLAEFLNRENVYELVNKEVASKLSQLEVEKKLKLEKILTLPDGILYITEAKNLRIVERKAIKVFKIEFNGVDLVPEILCGKFWGKDGNFSCQVSAKNVGRSIRARNNSQDT